MTTVDTTIFVSDLASGAFLGGTDGGADGLAFDSSGNLYCSNLTDNTISEINSNGDIIQIITSAELNLPSGLVFDSAGNLYCANNNTNSVLGISPGVNGAVSTFSSGGLFEYPSGLTIDSKGNLYCSNTSINTIVKITSDRTQSLFATLPDGDFFSTGVTFDSDGNLYCANDANSIFKISNNGSVTTFIDSSLNNPQGIVFDSLGNLYCANLGDNTVVKISNGVVTTFITGLNGPRGLAIDSLGYLYCANGSNISKTTVPVNIPTTTTTTTTVPVSDICFPAETPITTDQGIIHIDKINTEIHTINNKKIVAITKTITKDKYLVCFEKNSIRNGIPSAKTIISKNHLIFNKGRMIKANEFVNNSTIYKMKYTGEILYNILMKNYNTIKTNNMICETLHPENKIAILYKILPLLSLNEQDKFIKKHNDTIENTETKYKKLPLIILNPEPELIQPTNDFIIKNNSKSYSKKIKMPI